MILHIQKTPQMPNTIIYQQTLSHFFVLVGLQHELFMTPFQICVCLVAKSPSYSAPGELGHSAAGAVLCATQGQPCAL